MLLLGHRISAYYFLPFVLVSLTLPAFTLSMLQGPSCTLLQLDRARAAPLFIAHPLIVIAVTGGFFLAGGQVSADTTLATASAAFWR